MTDIQFFKQMAIRLGASVCGIANINRFSNAPQGFHPKDIYSECKSVLVFGTRIPKALLESQNPVPYSHYIDVDWLNNDRIAMQLSLKLEDRNITGIPLPSSDPYLSWDEDRRIGKGLISMRHAAYLAGLGSIGRNTLLTNPDYGNMVRYGAVLLNIDLESDPIIEKMHCIKDCTLCIDNCPVHALDGKTVDQTKCRSHFHTQIGTKFTITSCYTCRSICPNRGGFTIK